ncbi:MAG: site-specific integrase, partial [Deltaproteobacteria bacterium]|nr:site-specific integrase [Deltaproteobacteria bacterium]
ALIEKASAHLKPIIVLSLETGMRKEEVLALKWDHLDFSGRSIFVEKSKNGESRNVPMSERLSAVLRKHPVRVGSPYVFAKKKNGKRYLDVKTAFEGACDRAEIVGFRFHDLRHTAASHMAMAGVPLKAIGAILGHKTSAMTDRYAHLSTAHLRDAVNSLPSWDSTGHNLVTNEKGATGK